jgi:hypothetical protein
VRRALFAGALLLAGCAQQDAALLVNMSGPFRIPADANRLTLDVFDGAVVIKHKEWCTTVTAACPDALAPQPSFAATVTLVQSGAEHPHVKINVELFQANAVTALGTNTASFQSGQTVEVPVELASP